MLKNEPGMSFFAFASSQQLLWASVILISKGTCGIHRQQLLIHATLNALSYHSDSLHRSSHDVAKCLP